jgi:transposase
MFQQYGIELSRKTMADWMMKCSDLFQPLYDKLRKTLLQQTVIQADKTTLNVFKEDKSTCYMGLYVTGTDTSNNQGVLNIVLYDYKPSRAGQCAVDGYLQVDGYAVMVKLKRHSRVAGRMLVVSLKKPKLLSLKVKLVRLTGL